MLTHCRFARQSYLGVLCREFSDQLRQIFTGVHANAKKHRQNFDFFYAILSHFFYHIRQAGCAQFQVGAFHIAIGHRCTNGCGKSLQRVTPQRVA